VNGAVCLLMLAGNVEVRIFICAGLLLFPLRGGIY